MNFLLLPVSTFYFNILLFILLIVSILDAVTDCMLLNLRDLIIAVSIYLSISFFESIPGPVPTLVCLVDWFWVSPMPILFYLSGQASAYWLKVDSFSTSGTHSAVGWT